MAVGAGVPPAEVAQAIPSGSGWFGRWRSRRAHRRSAVRLYAAIVEQARVPVLYQVHRVPDTLDGRFDMLVLHAFLVFRRLRALGPQGEQLAQVTFDRLIEDMDRNLREIGVGDLSVGKKVKVMARAFYGRVAAYQGGMDGTRDDLVEALRRNAYRGDDDAPAAGLADYVIAIARAIDALPFAVFAAAGPILVPDAPPTPVGRT